MKFSPLFEHMTCKHPSLWRKEKQKTKQVTGEEMLHIPFHTLPRSFQETKKLCRPHEKCIEILYNCCFNINALSVSTFWCHALLVTRAKMGKWENHYGDSGPEEQQIHTLVVGLGGRGVIILGSLINYAINAKHINANAIHGNDIQEELAIDKTWSG